MADQKISALNAKTTIHDTDLFPMVDIEAETDETKKITWTNLKAQILAELIDYIDKTHLSQDFGASATRLRNLIVEPIAGEILRIQNIGSGSPFSGLINAAGSGGLTATNVPYDGDSNENMFEGMDAYNGSSRWGQIILHNTTRGNSRKIVNEDLVNHVLTTTSSTDNWADNDVITVQSQTNAQAGYFDVDVSAEVPATTDAISIFVTLDDKEDNYDANRYVMFHPYITYDFGLRQWISATNALEKNTTTILLKIIDQKFTMLIGSGCADALVSTAIKAYTEYADT